MITFLILFTYYYTSMCHAFEIQLMDRSAIKDCLPFIPTPSMDDHKGEQGRIGVFGGSIEYTGAPYFGAMAALRTGADLVYVFCAEPAAVAIKSYSPEPMVLPCLDKDDALETIKPWLMRLHGILVGPGLGRHEKVTKNIMDMINFLKEDITAPPMIIDADGFFILYKHPKLLEGYPGNIFLTPNQAEFVELASVMLNITNKETIKSDIHLMMLSEKYGPKVVILLKGKHDMIAQSDFVVENQIEGSPRRSGGQGDLLAGCLTTLAVWLEKAEFWMCKRYTHEVLVAFAASSIIKLANQIAYEEKGRGLIATDMLLNIHFAYEMLFGGKEPQYFTWRRLFSTHATTPYLRNKRI